MAKSILLILNDIRSSENVGSIFRTGDAANVERIYLTGYTPSPVDRFRRPNKKLAKAALGAELCVNWEHRDLHELINELKREGVTIASVEQAPNAIAYDSYTPPMRVAYILGNEVSGIPEEVLKVSDVILEIPMHGTKESLNVSVAAWIILFNTKSGQ